MVISPSTNPYPLQRPTDSTSVTKILPVKMFSLIIVSTLLFNIDSKVVHTHTHTHMHTHTHTCTHANPMGEVIIKSDFLLQIITNEIISV